ncbi:hypothetical protein Fmac_003315 [Flemingia macrophylla]|uniref:Uncharacterized protein n=1 Tax=Flemingia macrophylla TaxID=520843 RepID=A0ABD1NMF7_9FABA
MAENILIYYSGLNAVEVNLRENELISIVVPPLVTEDMYQMLSTLHQQCKPVRVALIQIIFLDMLDSSSLVWNNI